MTATLTELHRAPGKLVRAAIRAGEKLTVTDQGEPCAKIVPMRKVDRAVALKALMAIGHVDIQPRK